MKYDLTPRLLIVIAAAAGLAATNVSQARPDTGASDSRSALAEQLASGQDKLEKTAEKLVGVEDVIDVAQADVQRIAIELAEGRDPMSVTQELLQVRTRVDQAAKILPEVVADLDILHDVFTKIVRAARTLQSPVISRQASTALRRVRTLQTRSKNDQTKIAKLNLAIQALLDKTKG